MTASAKARRVSEYGVLLDQNVLLNEPEAALAGTGKGSVPVFVNGSFGQRVLTTTIAVAPRALH